MKKSVRACILHLSLLGCIALTLSFRTDEGMYPLSALQGVDLEKAGLRIPKEEIFNPGKVSLTNALVRLGGCTGSFVSGEGLVITNHHCVEGAVSRVNIDYIEKGFTARSKEEEIPVGIPCRITMSYQDVSKEVLEGVGSDTDPATRTRIIGENIRRITEADKKANPDLTVEISEMFTGRSYTLFRYMVLQDTRLVYVPPVSIGQFGDETDNWVWPRHNADFSIVRAYVGPDGKPAKYSKDNKPFKPARHLQVNPNGTREGDFVFIMGYPGRTFRHQPFDFLRYQQECILPGVSNWFDWQIRTMKQLSENNATRYAKFYDDIQGLSNTEKNYRGKLQGLRRTNVMQEKEAEDRRMELLTRTAPEWMQYDSVFSVLKTHYDARIREFPRTFLLQRLVNDVPQFYLATLLARSRRELNGLPPKEQSSRSAITEAVKKDILKGYAIEDAEFERLCLMELLRRMQALNPDLRPAPVNALGDLAVWEKNWMKKTILNDTAAVMAMLRKGPEKLINLKDPLIQLADQLLDLLIQTELREKQRDDILRAQLPSYIALKEQLRPDGFTPDANATLRLTYGNIKGYSPNDGEWNAPYTTLDGVFEKANTLPDYKLERVYADKLRVKNPPAMFRDPKTGKVVVAFLYNLDTTGGNSGSPVLDADGRLIGVNFDRAWTATLNDFAWSPEYSRSIGVDIRYCLYVMRYVSDANNVLAELGVNF
jgi:hypothetical protein